MKVDNIDANQEFDFGRVSEGYAKYRNIYPESMYRKLRAFGIGIDNQNILDLGSGPAVLPIKMCQLSKKIAEEEAASNKNTPQTSNAHYISTDISENQVIEGKKMVESNGLTKDIDFKVCGAEDTGFADNEFDIVIGVQCFHYFDTKKAVPEIKRILKKADDNSTYGRFCKIFIDWMPFEDEICYEMQQLVLKYNPNWSAYGFKNFKYNYPEWAEENGFEIETIYSYSEKLVFEKEAWIGRILTCRGVGASLPKDKVKAFEDEYREILKKYPSNILKIKHQIHIEIYRNKNK